MNFGNAFGITGNGGTNGIAGHEKIACEESGWGLREMVALLTVDAKASAQWLAGLELSRKLNRLRALALSPHCGRVRFCVKFRLKKRAASAASIQPPHCLHA